jgi:O-Antigen ligase
MQASLGTSSVTPLHRHAWYRINVALSAWLALDGADVSSQSQTFRQLPFMIVVAIGLYSAARAHRSFDRLSLAGASLACLAGVAAPGLVLNKAHGEPSSLFTGIALSTVALSVYVLPRSWLAAVEGRAMLASLRLVAFAWAAVALISVAYPVAEYIPQWSFKIHERAFLMPLLYIPFLARRQWMRAALVAAVVLIFLVYDPRTTLLLVIVLSLPVAALVFSPLPRKTTYAGFALAILLGAMSVGPLMDGVRAINAEFKAGMGSYDNAKFREVLLDYGLAEFRTSPLWGSMFYGPSGYYSGFNTVDPASGRLVPLIAPLHNDYLEFLTKGGLLGFGLMVLWLTGTFMLGMKNMSEFRASARHELALWQGVTIVALVMAIVIMLFNPVVNTPQGGFWVYWLVAQVFIGDRARRALRTGDAPPMRAATSGGIVVPAGGLDDRRAWMGRCHS